jgi:hypothetical protein
MKKAQKELANLNPSDKIFRDFGVEELQENTAWYIKLRIISGFF